MFNLPDNKFRTVLIAIAAAVVIITGAIAFYLNGIGAVDGDSEEDIDVVISSGSGATAIVEVLDENGLVKNKFCAKILARLGGYNTLQANTYVFSKSMTLTEMFSAINTADPDYVSQEKFTIIEGATVPEAAEAIAEGTAFAEEDVLAAWSEESYLKELIESYWFLTDDILNDDIMYPLEGYLYPETYFVNSDEMGIEEMTAMILDKTDEVLSSKKDEIEASGWSVHEFLTLASIVESESLYDEDRAKIAGVFVNRLDSDMALQSDITVLYALQEKRVSVTYEDLEVDSKYNTYLYTGLPVGPVSSVQEGTMDDVLNYEESDYYFFFALEDGSVIYSETAEEHEAVVAENKWY